MIKRWVFLRSAHLGENERHGPGPSPDLSENTDMWTHLFARAIDKAPGVEGIIVREGSPYEIRYNSSLVDIRLEHIEDLCSWGAEVIINRGGYKGYLPYLEKMQDVPAIYMGCGVHKINPYVISRLEGVRTDLVLVDSRIEKLMITFFQDKDSTEIFHKPAAENIIKKVRAVKKFDFVFNCHRPEEFKGCAWLAPRIPDGASVLRIGPEDEWFKKEFKSKRISGMFTGKIPKDHVPGFACSASIGIVCDDGERDSGPRVLPEFLRMGIPVIVRKTVQVDFEACVPPQAGIIVGDADRAIQKAQILLRDNSDKLNPEVVYDRNLSIDTSADHLVQCIDGIVHN